MPAPHITPLPTPPSRSQSPDTFSTDADAFLGALPEFQTDANTQADYLDGLADQVTLDAASANAAAAVATGAANYKGDYSAGTTYQIGDSVSYNGRRYVAKTVNTGVTPADGTNWFLINDGDVLGPVSATNNELVLFDGTTGKFIKNGVGSGAPGQSLLSGGGGSAPVWGSPFPNQTGNANKFLTTDGTTPSWAPLGAAIGDVLYSTQAPDATWLACNGSVYLKVAYPTLSTKLGSLSNPYQATWTSANRGGLTLHGIVKVGNRWIAALRPSGLGNYGVYSSTDLTNWTTLIPDQPIELGKFYYVSGSNRIVSSEQKSVNYLDSPFTTFSASVISGGWYAFYEYSGTIGGLVYNGSNTFVICGSNRPFSGSDTARLAYSTDGGVNFTRITSPVSGFTNVNTFCNSAAYGNGRFVVSGNLDASGNLKVMYSTNGTSWTLVQITTGTSSPSTLFFLGGYFYIGISSGSMWRSTDAVTWTSYNPANKYVNSNLVAEKDGILYWGNKPGNTAYLYSTDNGTTWNTINMVYGTNPSFTLLPNNGSVAGEYIFSIGPFNGNYDVVYSTGYDYNPATQFKLPTFNALSTVLSPYSAPINAYIKAALA